jgi:ABC-type nitrate/sulfonate/bicarbonate transport system permease component
LSWSIVERGKLTKRLLFPEPSAIIRSWYNLWV